MVPVFNTSQLREGGVSGRTFQEEVTHEQGKNTRCLAEERMRLEKPLFWVLNSEQCMWTWL